MENQKQEIDNLKVQLLETKARGFDIATKASEQNDALISEVTRLRGMLDHLCKLGGGKPGNIEYLVALVAKAGKSDLVPEKDKKEDK